MSSSKRSTAFFLSFSSVRKGLSQALRFRKQSEKRFFVYVLEYLFRQLLDKVSRRASFRTSKEIYLSLAFSSPRASRRNSVYLVEVISFTFPVCWWCDGEIVFLQFCASSDRHRSIRFIDLVRVSSRRGFLEFTVKSCERTSEIFRFSLGIFIDEKWMMMFTPKKNDEPCVGAVLDVLNEKCEIF